MADPFVPTTVPPERRAPLPAEPVVDGAADKPSAVLTPAPSRVYREMATGQPTHLEVSDPNEPAEREADAVAKSITDHHEPDPPPNNGYPKAGPPHVHRSATGSASPAGDPTPQGPGAALPAGVRAWSEPRFGRSFDDVRVHTDPAAARAADRLSANAFTVGNHITFGVGRYNPDSAAGQRLLAHELTHVVHGGGGRVRRQPVDYSAAPVPPDYDAVVSELRVLYAKKKEIGRATELDEEALAEVNAQIQERLDKLRMLGVMSDDFTVESKVSAPGGPQELRVNKPIITRSPAEGPLHIGRRMRFQLATDWLPPDEIPHVEWRWKTKDSDRSLMYKEGFSCEFDETFWGTSHPGTGHADVQEWYDAGGATFYAKIKLGDKPPVLSNEIYLTLDKRLPHEIPGFTFKIAPAKPAVVVGEDPRLHVVGFTVKTSRYWVEWTLDGEVINLAPGVGGGVVGRPFDSTGKKPVSARLFLKEDSEAKNPLATASTTVDVQDLEATGRETLDRGEQLGLYTPLSDYKKSHDAAMAEMGTRAKLGETGSAKEYWQKRLNAKAEQLKKLEEKVPDYRTTTNVAGKDYETGPTAPVSSTPVPAVIVYPSGEQVVQPISIYLITRKSGQRWTASVLDITGKIYRFDGDEKTTSIEAAASAFASWKSNNEYPVGGKVVYTFRPPGWTFDKTFGTTTAWKIAEGFLDAIIAVGAYVAIGLLMLAPDATITKVLGLALTAAVTVRGGMAIKDSLSAGGSWLDKENIIEMVVIITSILGGAGAVAKTSVPPHVRACCSGPATG